MVNLGHDCRNACESAGAPPMLSIDNVEVTVGTLRHDDGAYRLAHHVVGNVLRALLVEGPLSLRIDVEGLDGNLDTVFNVMLRQHECIPSFRHGCASSSAELGEFAA